jgi:hypothetical protein
MKCHFHKFRELVDHSLESVSEEEFDNMASLSLILGRRVEFIYDIRVQRDCYVQLRPIPEAFYLHGHRCENLKFC